MDRPYGHRTTKASLSLSLGGLLKTALGGAVLLTLAACGTSNKDQDVTKVELQCFACHGVNGKNDSSFYPRLAGQQKDYIISQIKMFQDHSRADPYAHRIMWGVTVGLSDSNIVALAEKFSSAAPLPGVHEDPATVESGRKIYEKGIAEQNVPVCASCHGSQAQGAMAQNNNPTYPRLAGQHRIYLENQLAGFSSNARDNKTMHQNAVNLTDDQIHQVATFLASL